MKKRMSRPFVALAGVGVAIVAVSLRIFWTSVWRVGYDVRNCPGCVKKIDWTAEKAALVVGENQKVQFEEDGVIVLTQALAKDKVDALTKEVDNLPTTFMTDVLARFTLPQYLRYEHHVDTRSELVRDWAVHGPLGKWAAELLGTANVRLYNAETIYHNGPDSSRPCSPSWHRDTIAAPFDTSHVRSITFNVYLEDIGPDAPNGDVLIYMKGSHKDLNSPPTDPEIIEPHLKVGDVLAHDPNVFHSPSGRGCWWRRSVQFRYFAASDTRGEATRFSFGRNRWPHGPIPWTLAHSPELYPHGLHDGDVMAGPGYPLVFPKPLEEEHTRLSGNVWTIRDVLSIMKQSQAKSQGDGSHPPEGFMTLDGPVMNVDEWATVELPAQKVSIPLHKKGPGYKQFLTTGTL